MIYALVKDGAIVRTADFPGDPPELAASKGAWLVLVDTPRPEYDPMTHGLREAPPLADSFQCTRQWEVFPLPAEEAAANAAALIPRSVTMRQARLALLGAGKLAAVDAAIDAMGEPTKTAARIELEYAGEVQRHNGFVAALGPALGLTDAQIDALFVAAAGL